MSSDSKTRLSSTYSTSTLVIGNGTSSGNGNGHGRHIDVEEANNSFFYRAFLKLWSERRFVAKAAAIGLVFATAVAFIMRPRYEAITRLMPPEKQGLQALAALPLLAGGGGGSSDDKSGGGGGVGALAGGLMSDALGLKSSGALMIGVLRSDTVEDRLIDQFDLRKVYGHRYYKETRQELEDHTDIKEDRKSGIIAITVEDKSPQRAADLARAYTNELNSMLSRLSTSAAGKERAFIEERLKTVKHDLDQATVELSQFSSANTTLDVKEQAKAMVESAANLQGQLIAAEANLSSLQQVYTNNNVRVRSAEAQVQQLRKQLAEMRGTDQSLTPQGDATDGKADDALYPSIRKLPILGIKYADLYRRAKIQEVIFEVLSKQYEMAKVQEAKELPTVRVLDEPMVPERKARPHRLLMMLGGLLLGAFFSSFYVIGRYRWETLSPVHTAKVFGERIHSGLREDVALARTRIPKLRTRKTQEQTASPQEDIPETLTGTTGD